MSFPHVIGVGGGFKFKDGSPLENKVSIHFYVDRKVKRPRQRLPAFVYARSAKGKLRRNIKLSTDVIQLKKLSFAYSSGSEISMVGETGTLSLLFRNKAGPGVYLLTCAHVAGDVRVSPPVNDQISSSCCPSLFATTIVNSTQVGGFLEYDVALAEVNPNCSHHRELFISETKTPITGFMPPENIIYGLNVDCAFSQSINQRGQVASIRTQLPLSLDRRDYMVGNLFIARCSPVPGDSGGLFYADDLAVGILVGRDFENGWAVFQPIAEAFEHLQRISPVAIRCF